MLKTHCTIKVSSMASHSLFSFLPHHSHWSLSRSCGHSTLAAQPVQVVQSRQTLHAWPVHQKYPLGGC